MPLQLQVLASIGSLVYLASRSYYFKECDFKAKLPWALLLGSLYFLYVFALPLTSEPYRGMASKLLEYKLSFIVFPFAFTLISKRYISQLLSNLHFFIIGAICSAAYANIAFIGKYFIAKQNGVVVNHVLYREYFESINGQHPTYMSMYLAFGIVLLLLNKVVFKGLLRFILIYILLLFMLPLMAKSPLLALVLILIHISWLKRDSLYRYKYVFVFGFALALSAYFFVPMVNQRVNEMAGLFSKHKPANIMDNSVYVRKMIWNTDKAAISDYWLTGVGPGRLMQVLAQRYCFHSIFYVYNVNAYDPHNEYIYQWLSFGILGLLLWVGILLFQMTVSIKRKAYLYSYFLIIIIITCFTESILATQHGIMFYSFFASILFFDNQKSRKLAI